jgi:mono/diheme cytochrome c family protein
MMSTTNSRTTIIVGMASLAAAVVVAAVMLITAAPRTAQAFPAYAEKTGMHCAVCHVNPKGGGPLNAYGTKWFTGGMKTPAATPKKAKK